MKYYSIGKFAELIGVTQVKAVIGITPNNNSNII